MSIHTYIYIYYHTYVPKSNTRLVAIAVALNLPLFVARAASACIGAELDLWSCPVHCS